MLNDDNVYYCKRCLSLSIIKDNGISYCSKCGCAIIDYDTFDSWEKLCKENYPHFRAIRARNIISLDDLKVKNNYYTK